ncbi:MAG: ATP-binding protein, partial [Bacteroidota bacterium]
EVLARERANLARKEAVRVKKIALENAERARQISVEARLASKKAELAGEKAKKEAKIAQQARQDALVAQNAAEEAQEDLEKLNYFIILGAILFVALALLGIFILGYYARAMRKAKKKVEQQANELQDKNQALKSSEHALEEKARQLQENNKELESLSEELRQQNDVVSQQRDNLAEKTYELEALTEELRQQNEVVQSQNKNLEELQTTKDMMISAVNHDLRNPLNALMNFSKPGYPGQQKELIQLIHQKSRRMEALIEDIMNVYRAEKLQINPEVHAPYRAIEEATREIKDMLGQEDMPKIYNESDPNLFALFDYRSIERVLENFLTNAIKYTEEDGEIHFRTQLISIEGEKDQLRISISDTGQGISKDKLATIFEPFVNPNARSLGSAKSVGIGLTFCKTIVEAHQSQLHIDSEEGQGTMFYFDLPLVKKVNEKSQELDEEAQVSLSKDTTRLLLPYLEELRKLDVEDYSEVEEVLHRIPESNPEITSWKAQLTQVIQGLG